MLILELPLPPSINHYWRMGRGRIYLSPEGVRYKQVVACLVRQAHAPLLVGPVALLIDAYPPDHRIRDLDNLLKALLDALGGAGLYRDDSLIKHLSAWMCPPVPNGKVVVTVTENPDRNNPPQPAHVF